MPYEVSQQTQRLDVAYAVLSELVRVSIEKLDTDFHVLSAARIIVHDEYLRSVDRDSRRRAAAGSTPPAIPSIDGDQEQDEEQAATQRDAGLPGH